MSDANKITDALVKCKSNKCHECPIFSECGDWRDEYIEVPPLLLQNAIDAFRAYDKAFSILAKMTVVRNERC